MWRRGYATSTAVRYFSQNQNSYCVWTRGELDPFLLHAMESFYRYTTGPGFTSSVNELYKNLVRFDTTQVEIVFNPRTMYENIS